MNDAHRRLPSLAELIRQTRLQYTFDRNFPNTHTLIIPRVSAVRQISMPLLQLNIHMYDMEAGSIFRPLFLSTVCCQVICPCKLTLIALKETGPHRVGFTAAATTDQSKYGAPTTNNKFRS
jgi:hypothetical protein